MIDISRLITADVPVWPGDPPVVVEPLRRISEGAAYNVLRLGCTTHLLTHLDAPYHFIEEGATLDALPLERFVSPAIVVECPAAAITPDLLPREFRGLSLLFHTGSRESYLTPEAAEALAAGGANLAGVDSSSVDPQDSESFPAHRILLGNEILILENADLSQAPAGRYTLIALPLKIARADGSPVRAVLLRDEDTASR